MSKIEPLPLGAVIGRRVERGKWLLVHPVATVIGHVYSWLCRLEYNIDGRLVIPEGAVVSQSEYPELPEAPWIVKYCSDVDYILVQPFGKPFIRSDRNSPQEELYVWREHVRPLPNQFLAKLIEIVSENVESEV